MKRYNVIAEAALMLLAVGCVIMAVCMPEISDMSELLASPFAAAGEIIRRISLGGNIAGGWCLYIFIGIIPLIFPAVRIIVRKRSYKSAFLWIALSAYTFAMLYLLVNLHILDGQNFTVDVQWYETTRAINGRALCMTWYAFALLCILFGCSALIKSKPHGAYVFAQVIIYIIAAICVFGAFFEPVLLAVQAVDAAQSATLGQVNMPLELFSACFSAITGALPGTAAVILLAFCARLVGDTGRNGLDPVLVKGLNKVILLAKVSVAVGLISAIAGNAVQFALARWVLTTRYSITFPVSSLLVVCLVIIAAGIMKHAVAASEENKLVI